MEAGGRVIGDLAQADAAGTKAAVLDLDGADDQHFALMAAPATARDRIVFTAARDFGFIDLDQSGKRAAARSEHAAAQLGADQPRRLVGAETELALQLQSRDAVGVGRHQISGPEPGGQRQLGVMHDGSGGHRGLATTAGAFIGPRLGVSRQALPPPQPGQTNPSGQRAATRYRAQAASSPKRCWNSINERGKSVITATEGNYVRDLF